MDVQQMQYQICAPAIVIIRLVTERECFDLTLEMLDLLAIGDTRNYLRCLAEN
jgi:hypothetical protein